MGVGGGSKWMTAGVVLAVVTATAGVGLLKLYLNRRKQKESDKDSVAASSSSYSTSSGASSEPSPKGSDTNIHSSTSSSCKHGLDKRRCARASVGIRRRIHYFERHPQCQSTAEQTLSYLDLTMSNDFVLIANNEMSDKGDGYEADGNQETTLRNISSATAIAILKRLGTDEKICRETMNVFRQWLQTPSAPNDTTSLGAEGDGLNIFVTWYRELQSANNGQGCQGEDIFNRCSYLLQQLSYLESLQQEKGLVWLMTSRTESNVEETCLSDVMPTVSRDNEEPMTVHRPKSVVKIYQSIKGAARKDKELGLNILLKKPRAYQFYEMDWVEGEGQSECVSMPYVPPCGTDRCSSRFINLWLPVCKSAARADYHVIKIGSRFQHLFQSRFLFYYTLNLSSIPVAGTYSYFRPF